MIQRNILLAMALIFSYSTGFAQPAEAPIDVDILLRNGTLHLGDGKPPQVGDVAITGERIVAVGKFKTGTVRQEIDCRGQVVCPGFIDLHNHSDRQVLRKETRAVVNFVTQGCTTIVTGNCGSGPVDAGAYYDEIDESGVGVNVVHLLPQGALRRQVIGNDRRSATPEEIEAMRELAGQAMRDGVWGMSTGLIYVPSSYADTAELIEIAKVVGQHGGIYASHMRNENVELLSAVEEAMEIGKQGKLPVHISHYKSSGKDSWGLVRVATDLIEKQRKAGQRITADQYPYTASSTSLDATVIPAWARSGGRAKMLERFEDKEQGPRIKSAMAAKLRELDEGARIQIASYERQPSWTGKRLAEIAKAEKIEPLELVLRIARNGGAAIVNHSINEEDVRFVMTQPWVATASDGRAYVPSATVPHPRNYGTFPRKIGHYAIREKTIPLEHAIRSATGLPADILGLKQRGYLRAGYSADVVVWHPEKLIDTATFDDPHNYSQGLDYVFVNGRPALSEGRSTGALAGRALRHDVPKSLAVKQDPTSRLDALFANWNKPDSPGCAVGVIRDGKMIYRRGFGSANLDYQVPIDENSVFYLASVSKQFVAAAIAMLALDGKISLDDDVRKYVPELPKYDATITVRHLVHHTSGLRDYLSLMDLAGKKFADVHTDQELLELICRQQELNFPPGEKHLYCNTGYFLMSEIVRRVSKKSLRQFTDDRIFKPLKMNNTHFHDDHTAVVKNRVVSYGADRKQFRMSYLANWDKVGSGGLLSTIDDLILWDRNFDDRKVGGDSLSELMHQPGKLNDGTKLNYAFGLVVGEYKGLKTVGHGGSFMGFRTVLLRFPEQEFSVIILSNVGSFNPDAVAKSIADMLLQREISKSLQAFAGRYHSDELQTTYDINVKGTNLVVTRNGAVSKLQPTKSPTAFVAGNLVFEFTRDDTGKATEFSLNSGRANRIRFRAEPAD